MLEACEVYPGYGRIVDEVLARLAPAEAQSGSGLDARDALLSKAETVRENMEDLVAEAQAASEARKAKAGAAEEA